MKQNRPLLATRHVLLMALSVVFALIVSGCSLFGVGVDPPPGDDDTENVLFADDFSGDLPGAVPANWTTSNIPDYASLQVIEDSAVPAGKAVHFKTVLSDVSPAAKTLFYTPRFGEAAADAKVIAIEFWVKWVEGTAVYHYITTGPTHAMLFQPVGNELKNREQKPEGGNTWNNVATLNEGWNRIRLVADSETATITYYVNDMDNPVPGTFKFLNKISSWEDIRLQITHETHATEHREAYYAGFKIWVVE